MDKYSKSRSEPKRRSRSRSPHERDERRRVLTRDGACHHHHRRDEKRRSSSSSSSSSSSPPAPPAKKVPPPAPKISMSFNKTPAAGGNKSGIQIKLGAPQIKKPIVAVAAAPLVQTSSKITNVFNADDDSEPEEMPAEAKMRMKNIGRETPTSSGPNSFGKTKQGFIDSKKMFERKLKQMAEDLAHE